MDDFFILEAASHLKTIEEAEWNETTIAQQTERNQTALAVQETERNDVRLVVRGRKC